MAGHREKHFNPGVNRLFGCPPPRELRVLWGTGCIDLQLLVDYFTVSEADLPAAPHFYCIVHWSLANGCVYMQNTDYHPYFIWVMIFQVAWWGVGYLQFPSTHFLLQLITNAALKRFITLKFWEGESWVEFEVLNKPVNRALCDPNSKSKIESFKRFHVAVANSILTAHLRFSYKPFWGPQSPNCMLRHTHYTLFDHPKGTVNNYWRLQRSKQCKLVRNDTIGTTKH